METRRLANPATQDLDAIGTATHQRDPLSVGQASQANPTFCTISASIFENAGPDRATETHGGHRSFSGIGSQKQTSHSVPGSTLLKAFVCGLSSEERDSSQNDRRHLGASYGREHVDVPALGNRGLARSGPQDPGSARE